jgi:uncharacterized cupin superfamily protein
VIAHWDEVPGDERAVGVIAGRWRALGAAAGSVGVGLNRVEIPEGMMSTPVHVHRREEEINFVLGGGGLLWQDGGTCELQPGDTVVHRVSTHSHTLVGGRGGLDVLVFGPRLSGEAGFLPRVGIAWLARRGVRVEERHPWEIEAEEGLPDGEPVEQPANVVNVEDVGSEQVRAVKRLARAAGAVATGLNWRRLPPGAEGAPPHCHTADEELFVILDGEGTLELWDPPQPGRAPPRQPGTTHPVRRGHVISRPPGTRISHSFRAGEHPLTYLAYGTKEPHDLCFYPRSHKVAFRGLGLVARLEPLADTDGEPSDHL